MRFSTVAAAVCLSLSAAAAGIDAAAPALLADAPAAASATSGTPAAAPPSDAAARHAKRTACLKDARAKKLLGADKTAFLKSCIAAP
jgi:psiF repeat